MREIVQKYISAYNDFDTETMVSLVHADCVYESKTDGMISFSIKGKHNFRQICNVIKNNYKYRKQIIEGFTQEGNIAMVKLYFKATLAVNIEDLGKKGEAVAFETTTSFEFKDGLIYKITNFD